ncbi:MAG: AraC family transcriptional regulator [Lachnospiraceae bacterium]
MVEYNSCIETIDACIASGSFAFAHLYKSEKTMDVHIHNCYELYYSISGGKQFLIDNCFYPVETGDLFFINQFESHHLSLVDETEHERIIFSITPEFLAKYSTSHTDLNVCFHERNRNTPHKLHLNTNDQKHFLFLVHQLSTTTGIGADLLEQCRFVELMVFINSKFLESTSSVELISTYSTSSHEQVQDILSYINRNIQTPFTIETLATHFFMSSSYICRIFKAATGTTINKYITAKRIALAKSLLSQGYTVTDTCEQCGFNDYSNFLKAFTKAVGISPKKYAQRKL